MTFKIRKDGLRQVRHPVVDRRHVWNGGSKLPQTPVFAETSPVRTLRRSRNFRNPVFIHDC